MSTSPMPARAKENTRNLLTNPALCTSTHTPLLQKPAPNVTPKLEISLKPQLEWAGNTFWADGPPLGGYSIIPDSVDGNCRENESSAQGTENVRSLKGLKDPCLVRKVQKIPMRSLLRRSMERFLRAMDTALTTLSESDWSSSTSTGSPLSFRTVARMYVDHWPGHTREKKQQQGLWVHIPALSLPLASLSVL